MNTSSHEEQHLVLFVSAGDGSDAACDAVAKKLAEKFGAPYERMLSSVRQSPRVFKRNLNKEQAESCAALLRSLGAVAEVQRNGETADAQEEPAKPPPPEVVDRNCPFCGRPLQAGGVCVICRPKEVGSAAAKPTEADEPPADTPEVASDWATPTEAACAGCGGSLDTEGQCPVCDTVAPEVQEPSGPQTPEEESASIENDLSALLSPEELGVCPTCCGPMEQDGTCLICPSSDAVGKMPAEAAPAAVPDVEPPSPVAETAPAPEALDELPLEPPGFKPPPVAEAAPESGTLDELPLEPPGFEELPVADATPEPETLDVSQVEPPGFEPPPMAENAAEPEAPAPDEASPFEPLAPLGADPIPDTDDVCRSCGGPRGTDGFCLICGAGGDEPRAEAEDPAVEAMAVTGNEPPPAEPLEVVDPAGSGTTSSDPATVELPNVDAPAPAKREKTAPATGKKGISLDLMGMPRAFTIPGLLTLLLLISGIGLAMGDKFIVASCTWFLALLAGLVALWMAIQHLEKTKAGFPKLPKIVLVAFMAFLFFAGSGAIATYAAKQSALFLLDKAGEGLQAEVDRLNAEANGATDADANALESSADGGQIIMENEMLDRAVAAEAGGENDPRAALDNWRAYLEGFPDGERSTEAKRRISHWRAVVRRKDALDTVIARDRKGNNEPAARVRDWNSCLATYGNTSEIREHATERIAFWESMQQQNDTRNFPYWASLRLGDGREFSGKVVAENESELKMVLPNRLQMSFNKNDFEMIDSDHINGKRVEAEQMRLGSGVVTEQPKWGHDQGMTVLNTERAAVETMVSFRLTGFYHFEVMARADRDSGGFPSVILSLNGEQQERIRFDSEEWKLYKVTFPFRIPAGEHRLEIVYPPHYQTVQDKRTATIDYFTTAMVE